MRHAVCFAGQVRTASCRPLDDPSRTLAEGFRDFVLPALGVLRFLEVGLERLLDAEQLVVLLDGALERVADNCGWQERAVG